VIAGAVGGSSDHDRIARGSTPLNPNPASIIEQGNVGLSKVSAAPLIAQALRCLPHEWVAGGEST
jgi:hypothetical protein